MARANTQDDDERRRKRERRRAKRGAKSAIEIGRAPNGHFLPGVSPNPSGRPAVLREVRSLAREHTEAAIAVLVGIAGDKKAPAAARVSACAALLDRAWGRPEQSLAIGRTGFELPEDFTPTSPTEAANLYTDMIAGLVSVESAVAALDRGAATVNVEEPTPSPPEPAPTVPPEAHEAPPIVPMPREAEPTPEKREAPSATVADSSRFAFDDAGCPTAAALEAGQRAREAAAIALRAANEERIERENERVRAALAERERRVAEEEA